MIKNKAGLIRGAGKGENPGSEYLHFQHIFNAIVQNPNLDLVKITSYRAFNEYSGESIISIHHLKNNPNPMNSLQHILFLDVETVSVHKMYDELDEHGRHLWQQKIGYMARRDDHEWSEEEYSKSYTDKAAIYAEFGKAIVISAGIISQGDAGRTLRIKSFYGHDEKEILQQFSHILDKNFNDPNLHILCGHNIREFDIPYLCRRMTINGILLPNLFNITGKKPWEVKYIADTMELWKFGDHKNFTSLDLLAYTLGIPSPKESMDGSKVGHAYWHDDQLEQIKQYCERDVLTVAQVYLRLHNLPLLGEGQVVVTN